MAYSGDLLNRPGRSLIILPLALLVCLSGFSAEGDWESMNLEIARLYSRGELESAVTLAEQSLSRAKSEFGPAHLNTAKALNNLANLYFRIGRIDEAGWMYEDAIRAEEGLLGSSSKSAADTRYNLAMLLLYRGDKRKAASELERVMHVYRTQKDPDLKAISRVEDALKLARQNSESNLR